MKQAACSIALVSLLGGCAGIRFNAYDQTGNGFTYFEPSPFLQVKVATDCSVTSDVVILPGRKRSLTLRSGLGSSKLNIATSNGMITTIGQETDTKIPETITAAAGLLKTAADANFAEGGKAAAVGCPAKVSLFPISSEAGGSVSVSTTAISLPVGAEPRHVETKAESNAAAAAIMGEDKAKPCKKGEDCTVLVLPN